MERGFFDRSNYTQIDHQGFNHSASWVDRLAGAAPPAGPERFRAVRGEIKPIRARRTGHILVLLQLPGDAQLKDSEIRHPAPLVRAVEDAAPLGVELRVRAHPMSNRQWPTPNRARMIGGELEDAVGSARFAVTINSNSGNEALAWGCPVLCLGPAIYARAGAAYATKLADLPAAIGTMLDGWRPKQDVVRNYLYWLACRQWSSAELRDGETLRGLLDAATA